MFSRIPVQEFLRRQLFQAVREDNLEKVEELIEKGADIHSEENYALVLAIENCHLEIFDLLVKKGADIHTGKDKIVYLAAKNKVEFYELLLQKGVDINAHNGTALLRACVYGNLPLVKFLLEKGVCRKIDDSLYEAAFRGHLDIVKLLVREGAKLHFSNTGRSGIISAIWKGHLDIVKFFFESGIELHYHIDYLLGDAIVAGELEVAKFLITSGANIHAIKQEVLHSSVMSNRFDSVCFFIQNGGDIFSSRSVLSLLIRKCSRNESGDRWKKEIRSKLLKPPGVGKGVFSSLSLLLFRLYYRPAGPAFRQAVDPTK